jgi:putative methyltransferase
VRTSKEQAWSTLTWCGAAMIPRYVRCNNNVAEPDTLIEHLTTGPKPFTMVDTPSYPPAANTFFRDPHLKELLVFPPSTKFDQNLDYLNGGLILQDKASCFPAKVLMHEWPGEEEGEVIDGT